MRVGKGGDRVHDVVLAPVLEGEILNGEGDKGFMREEEAVWRFRHGTQVEWCARGGGRGRGGLNVCRRPHHRSWNACRSTTERAAGGGMVLSNARLE